MSRIEDLLAAKKAADAALAAAEQKLLAELLDAKEAHRADPNVDTATRRTEAAERMRSYRQVVRADRPATATVGGDAVPMTETTGE